VAHVARNAASYGVNVHGGVSVDMKAVKARKDRIVRESIDNLGRWLGGIENLQLIRGHGRFVGPHAVDVSGQVLEAPRIFINVGGRALLPDWPGIDTVPVLTNTSLLELDTLPEHLMVVGGGYIGLEFAQMYRRFGSRVTVLESADRLLGREDPQVSDGVRAILEREGVEILLSVRDASVRPAPAGGIRVDLAGAAGPRTFEGSHLLAAVGRLPNTDDLGLDRAGIATDARGFIPVDDQLRTSVSGVWALGDINGRGAFTHTSYNDFEIVAANLFDDDPRRLSDRIPAYALFIDPPLGRIGMTQAEVRATGRPALIGVMPMTRVGRARERGETQGFMSVLVDAQTEKVLGASLLCVEGDEIAHCLLALMYSGASFRTMQRAVHIHPTVSELIPTLLGALEPLAPPRPD